MLTLPGPAGVSADSTGGVLLLFVLLHRSAVRTPRLPQDHPRHQVALQGPTAHRHQVLQQHGRRQEGGSSVGPRLHHLQLRLDQFDLTPCFPAESAGGADEHPEGTHQSHGERPAELPPIRAQLLLPDGAGLPGRTLSGQSRSSSSSNSRRPRVRNSSACCVQGDLETTAAIEGCIMDCLLAMVMKLSEVTFRPLFFKVRRELSGRVGAGGGARC